jgi:outer membrane protein OmpA-like peptidoglycan-associated protein
MFATKTDTKRRAPGAGKKDRSDVETPAKQSAEVNPLWQSLALHPGGIQAKLAISKPNDPCEQEADRIADRVMRMTASPLTNSNPSVSLRGSLGPQRKCAPCEDEEAKNLQRKERGDSADSRTTAPPIVHEALNSSGQPLDPVTRSFMEARFGQDFEHVRVHADGPARKSAEAVDAKAYTVGHHVVFGANRYAPASVDGRRLLAHELAHVMQPDSAKPLLQRDAEEEKEPPKMSVSGDSIRKSPPGGVAIRNGALEWKLEFVGKDTEITMGSAKDLSLNVSLGRDVFFSATYTPQAGASACPTITFTQTVQPTIGGAWDTGSLLYTRSPASGASVDLNLENDPRQPETEPFYSAGPRASGPGLEAKKDSTSPTGSATPKPTMGDIPFQRNVPKGVTAVRRFESAVICVESAATFGSISWGYTKTDAGVVTLLGGTEKDVRTASASADFEPTRKAFYSGFFQLSLNDFGVGLYDLTSKHKAMLDTLDTRDLTRVILVGANDNSGGPEAKADLSLKRAEAARDYLVKTRGVSGSLIQLEGHGVEARVPNPGGQKVSENRRVDVHMQRGAETAKPPNARPGSASEQNRLIKQNPRLTVKQAVDAIIRLDSTSGRIATADWSELNNMLNAVDGWRPIDPTVPDLRGTYAPILNRLKSRAGFGALPGREQFPPTGPISPEIDEALRKYEESKRRLEALKRERDQKLRELDQEYEELKEE